MGSIEKYNALGGMGGWVQWVAGSAQYSVGNAQWAVGSGVPRWVSGCRSVAAVAVVSGSGQKLQLSGCSPAVCNAVPAVVCVLPQPCPTSNLTNGMIAPTQKNIPKAYPTHTLKHTP